MGYLGEGQSLASPMTSPRSKLGTCWTKIENANEPNQDRKKTMIISASRRTDIPALYDRWFMNRIRAGWCAVPNPLNMKQISQVSLNPKEVDAIVFWSKNPAPMLPHLDELDHMDFRYYFQFTLNDYPAEFEPNIPSLPTRVHTFLDLSRRLGPLRVIWRYDPIIISSVTPYEFHQERFSWLAEELRGATDRVVVSIVDFYNKTERRLSQLEHDGITFEKKPESAANMIRLLRDFARIAGKQRMQISTCAEERDYSDIGIPPGRCIDEGLVDRIWSLKLRYSKDPSQRNFCLCMKSKDIGINDTCIHGCRYCYSTRNETMAKRRFSEHNPDTPALWGHCENPSVQVATESEQMRLFH